MTTLQTRGRQAPAFGRELVRAARPYLSGRRSLIALAVVLALAGLALNWGWLVAIGVAPVLLAALPCVAMCALGLCMNRMTGGACAADKDQAPEQARAPTADVDTHSVVPIRARPRIDQPGTDAALLVTADQAPASDAAADLSSTRQRS